MRRLRSPDGCPWDRKQTHESIRPYCLEEAYEVVEAIDEGDRKKLCDELGDLLLQVLFHAQLAVEESTFSIDDVIDSIHSKLIRRHPHVFRREEGDLVDSAEEVLEKWSKIKKDEGRKHLLDGIPSALPALLRATRMGEKAGSIGFDWKSREEVSKKVSEELEELREAGNDSERVEEELGDLLFALTSYARHAKVDAETALRLATEKFDRRFRWMEQVAQKNDRELSTYSAKELDQLWNEAKSSV